MFEFKSRQEEAKSYRKAGFSYYQISELMKNSTKQVWTNLKGDSVARDLTVDELNHATKQVGIPRGASKIKPTPNLVSTRCLESSFLATLTLTNGVCPFCKEQVFPIEDLNIKIDIKKGKEHAQIHKEEYGRVMETFGV
jgi:hypothetical protein